MSMSLPIGSVLLSCTGCIVAMESLVSSDGPSSMHLMTLVTFLLVVLQGLLFHPSCIVSFNIPPSSYLQIVALFFAVSVINNHSVNYQISFPLLIISRSGTLIANVILGGLLQRKIYAWSKYLAVLLVTAGIVLFTLASEREGRTPAQHTHPEIELGVFPVGLVLIILSLFGSAYMGILQEKLFVKYGKHPVEMMLNVHLYSLPLFGFFWQSIASDAEIYSLSHPILLAGLPIPRQWLSLFATCLLQLVCIRSVYELTSHLNSLHLTMILTLRKGINLLLSIWLFGNAFTRLHFVASLMVFVGTFEFFGLSTKVASLWRPSRAILSSMTTTASRKKEN